MTTHMMAHSLEDQFFGIYLLKFEFEFKPWIPTKSRISRKSDFHDGNE